MTVTSALCAGIVLRAHDDGMKLARGRLPVHVLCLETQRRFKREAPEHLWDQFGNETDGLAAFADGLWMRELCDEAGTDWRAVRSRLRELVWKARRCRIVRVPRKVPRITVCAREKSVV